MKTFLLFAQLVCVSTCFAQLKVTFDPDTDQDTITWERLADGDVTRKVKLKFSALNPAGSNALTITTLATSSNIHQFTALTLVPAAGTTEMEFPVTISSGTNPTKLPLFVHLQISYDNGSAQILDTLILRIVNETAYHDDDSFYSKITLLNAYNFDFSGKLESNYVGLFNLYEPARPRGEGLRQYGINIGVMKINYGLGADTGAVNSIENVRINPLDSAVAGKNYYRQYNSRSTTLTNSAWSYYAQPLWLFNPDGAKNSRTKVYYHVHLELFVNKLTEKTVLRTLNQETKIIPSVVPADFTIGYSSQRETQSVTTYYSSYMGVGATWDVNLTKTSALFLQFTPGITTNKPRLGSVSNYKGGVPKNEIYGFYLFRTSFNQKISESSRLVLSQEIRGLYPFHNPLFALFVGLNIKLDSILGLLK